MRKGIYKHIPQRTCIACRKVKDKRELIRLVCTGDGGVEVDLSGRWAGRGAYLCRSAGCWQEGLKGSRLEQALKTGISQENREKLSQ